MGVSLRVFLKNWATNSPPWAFCGQKTGCYMGISLLVFFSVFFEYDIDDEIAGLFFVIDT